MKQVFVFLFLIFAICPAATAQTFTFECVCDYVVPPDCDICNTQVQSRLLNGLLIRRSGAAFKWIEYPYLVRIQGNNAVIQELIFPNPETITINLSGTGFATMAEYMDSLQCNCGGGGVTYIAGPGIVISGDTIIAVDTSATNEIQQVDTFAIFSGNQLCISLSADGVVKHCITLPSGSADTTIVTAGTAIGISGTGTTGSPYVVTNTADLSVTPGGTNALQIALNTSGQTPIFVKGMGQVTVTESATGDTVKIGGVGGIYGVSDTTQPTHVLTIAANSTLTFQSQGDNFGGVVPFRVLSNGTEPDIQGWYANGDSLTLSRSDTEFVLSTPSGLTVMSGAVLALQGDSVIINAVGAAFSTEKTYLQITPGNVVKYTEGIPLAHLNQSGATTGQVVKWNGTAWVADTDGGATSVATVADSTAFRAFSATADAVIMIDKDRGGKFRKCTSCTADQYMVFTDATAQKWERYDYGGYLFPEWFGSGNGSANATLGIRRTIRYAENSGERVMFRFNYALTDSVHIRRKIHIEGGNHSNQSGVKSRIDFDLPDNRPAFWVNPTSQSMQGPTIKDMAFQDVSASGNRHCFEMFAEIADAKFLSTFFAENLAFVGWKRYPFYFKDLYTAGLYINMVNATSCGGIVGVDMSGTKLVTQSQGDTWTISNIVTGGTIPELVSGDTAMIDVRDVGNVMLENITLQGGVGTGISKQLIWADFGCVDIVEVYCELAGTGGLSNWGRFGNPDNPECDVNIRGLYFSVGAATAAHTFSVFSPAKVYANYISYGVGSPSTLFTRRGAGAANISIENFVANGRLPRVDAFSYQFPLTMQGTNDYREMRYPSGGVLWQMGKDTLFGPNGFGNIVGGVGAFSQDIDSEKGKVFKLSTTADRLYFICNLALPLELRGKSVSVSMTYKFVTSDSTGGDVNRWAIYDPVGSNYVSMANLQLNRWAVATDVFEFPVGSSSVELVLGDANGKFTDDNCQMWISDIRISYGQQLQGEAYDKPAKNDIIFRENISGANVAAFNNGDLVSTEVGLYQKKGGVWVLITDETNSILGDGISGQVAVWDGTTSLAGYTSFTRSGSNILVGPSGGDHVEIMPGTSEISFFNVGTIDARIWANDFGKLETNVGLEAVGNSAITGNLNVTGSITTSGHFLAPGISSAPFGSGVTTASGTLNAWSPTGTSPYVTFSENGIANRGAFGFPASSGDFVWTVGDQVLSSGTERMRLTSGGNLGIGVTPTQKLDVNGTTKTVGFQMPTGATNLYILQSDASGNGSWVAPSTLGDNWGSQAVQSTGSTLAGNGTAGAPLQVNTGGITATEIATDAVGSTEIAANAVGASELSSLGTAGTYGSATQVPVFTTDADGRVSAVTNTAITGLLSGLTATRIPFATAANALTDDNRLRWDNTNKRLSVGDTGGSPAASVHIAEGSVVSWEPLRAAGTVSGNMITSFLNGNNAGGASNNLVDLSVGGASAGDPAYRWLISGVDTWSMGVDNSDADKMKWKKATTPSTLSNVGITMTADATPLIGINNDAPLHPLHVIGRATATVVQGISGTPTHVFGTGAGSSPTLGTLVGCTNAINIQFTVGTTPTVGGNIVSITFPTAFSNLSFPTYSCGNDVTALENAAGKFVISATSATSFTLKHNALTAALTPGDVLFFRLNILGR